MFRLIQFLALIALVQSQVHGPKIDINVGTSLESLDDVVKAGEVNEHWMQVHNAPDVRTLVNATERFTTFYVSSPEKLIMPKPFIFAGTTVCKASIDNFPDTSVRIVPGEPFKFDVNYNCMKQGSSTVFLTMRLMKDPTENNLAAARSPPTIISLNYRKTCDLDAEVKKEMDKEKGIEGDGDSSTPTEEPKEVEIVAANGTTVEVDRAQTEEEGSAFPGFFVGNLPIADDVVQNGQTLERFELKRLDGGEGWASASVMYGPVVVAKRFKVTWNGTDPLNVEKALILSDNPEILTVSVGGQLANRMLLKPSSETVFSADFQCHGTGVARVTINLLFTDYPDIKVAWHFNKQCETKQKEIGSLVDGLNIGTAEDTEDVIFNGQAAADYIKGRDHHVAQYDTETDTASFYVSYNPSVTEGASIELKHPFLTEEHRLAGHLSEISRPELSGSLTKANELKPGDKKEIILTFNCVDNGHVEVEIEIQLVPSSSIVFSVMKDCAAPADHTTPPVAEVTKIPGLAIHWKPRLRPNERPHYVVDGVTVPSFNEHSRVGATTNDNKDVTQATISPRPYTTFYISLNTTKKDAPSLMVLGEPQVITTEDMMTPLLSGLASEGTTLDADHPETVLSLTYHCYQEGYSQVKLVIPILPPPNGVALREEPIIVEFRKHCAVEPRVKKGSNVIVSGLGGVGITGLNVGTKKGGEDVVKNGFPLNKYYGQRHLAEPKWASITVGAAEKSSTFYLSYKPDYDLELAQGIGMLKIDSIVVVSHDSFAKPVLSDISFPQVLTQDGTELEFSLTYNCNFHGLAISTVMIRLYPHGDISFTIPKQCTGASPPAGKVIPHLSVSVSNDETSLGEVVQNGLTQNAYVGPASKDNQFAGVEYDYEDSKTFYIRYDPPLTKPSQSLRALQPTAFCQKPFCNPVITHDLTEFVAEETAKTTDQISEEAQQEALVKLQLSNPREYLKALETAEEERLKEKYRTVEYELPREYTPITVTYRCLWSGYTPVTFTMPLRPKGRITFTWMVSCGAEDVALDQFDWGSRAGPDQGTGSYDGRFSYGSMSGSGGGGVGSSSGSGYAGGGDMEQWDEVYRGNVIDDDIYDYQDDDTPAVGETTDDNKNKNNDDQGSAVAFTSPLGFLDVGTHPHGSDVVQDGVTDREYLTYSGAIDDAPATVEADQESKTYYISVPFKHQRFGAPRVSSRVKAVADPTLSGPAVAGGDAVYKGQDYELTVNFHCKQPGVSPVLVSIPLLPIEKGYNPIIFKVLKLCLTDQFTPTEDFYWTAPRILTVGIVIIALVALGLGYKHYNKNRNAPFWPLPQADTMDEENPQIVENQIHE